MINTVRAFCAYPKRSAYHLKGLIVNTIRNFICISSNTIHDRRLAMRALASATDNHKAKTDLILDIMVNGGMRYRLVHCHGFVDAPFARSKDQSVSVNVASTTLWRCGFGSNDFSGCGFGCGFNGVFHRVFRITGYFRLSTVQSKEL